jgi:hypothetical protein
MREKHRLRVFENWVLKQIFESKRAELIGNCNKVHNKELHHLCFSPNIIKNKLAWIRCGPG